MILWMHPIKYYTVALTCTSEVVHVLRNNGFSDSGYEHLRIFNNSQPSYHNCPVIAVYSSVTAFPTITTQFTIKVVFY